MTVSRIDNTQHAPALVEHEHHSPPSLSAPHEANQNHQTVEHTPHAPQLAHLPIVNRQAAAIAAHPARPAPAQTPQEKTDAAYKTYQDASHTLASDKTSRAGRADVPDDQTAVSRAKKDFDDAVKREIAANVGQANQGVPPQYQTPRSQLITQFGGQISQRHAGDAIAHGEIKSAVNDYLKADTLIRSGYNGHRPELIGGEPGQWKGIDRVVLHETTRGYMSPDDVRKDEKLSVNSDAVITQDGSLIQQSQTGLRTPDHGIAGGVGTQRENGDANRWPPASDATESEKRQHAGTNFDIELDYNAIKWVPGGRIRPPNIKPFNEPTDAQYRSAAKAIADTAVNKYTALAQDGTTRVPGDYSPVINVEPHRYVDRGLPDAHTDPRNFDTGILKNYVNAELQAYNVPNTLVDYNGWS
jgi:hypothetical protein